MRDSIYRFTLDIHNTHSQLQITAKKNDNARKIIVNLMEKGKTYHIEAGCRAVFMMKKPDGNVLFNDCDIVGDSISYEFTEQTVSAKGLCECEIRLYSANDAQLTSPRFTMLVVDTVYSDGQVESSSEWNSIPTICTEAVGEWLEAHPEATTTVQNNSIGTEKFTPALRTEYNGIKTGLATEITNRQNAVSSETSRATTKEASLQGQIDALTVEAAGSAEPLATQAKVGVDGTTYASLKTRIDTEIGVVKGDLEYLNENPITQNVPITQNKYIDRNGTIIQNAGNNQLGISGYIRIPSFVYKIVGTKYPANISSLMYAMNFFDSNKVWISGIDYKESGTFTSSDIPANAEYIMLGDYEPKQTPAHNSVSITFYAFGINEEIESIKNPIDIDDTVIVKDVFVDKTVVKNTNIVYTTGATENNSSFVATNYNEIEPNTAYHTLRASNRKNAAGNIAFYDANKTYISGQGSNWTDFTTPLNAKYMRFSVYIWHETQDTFTFENVTIVKGTSAKAINDLSVFTSAEYSPLRGKKWIGIGDSITEINDTTDLRYHDYISGKYGMTFVNKGVGGSGYINRQNENKAFYQRCSNLDSDADIITVFGGVNDCLLSSANIGEPTDNGTTTWCGCVNALIDSVRNQYSYAPLGIISPLPCDWQSSESSHPTQLPSDENCNMSVFISKLKKICELRGVPFLDLFHQSGMLPNEANFRLKYFSCGDSRNGDGLHPNSEGHKLFYRKIERFIETLLVD